MGYTWGGGVFKSENDESEKEVKNNYNRFPPCSEGAIYELIRVSDR